LDEFLTACQQAGIEVEASGDIEKDLWDKFVFLASFAGITCLTRQPCRVLQDDERAFELFVAGLKEAVAVAAAEGVALDEDIIERYSGFVRKMAPDAQSSMLTDLQAGKPLENEWFAGKIVELGQQHKIPTPINHAYFVSMKPFQAGGV
jgi:2-dehydropantoate 2-reductase